MTDQARRKAAVKQAIASGLHYILAHQAKEGTWTDWQLPPGESSVWTTAFVGHKLSFLAADLTRVAAAARRAAAVWLRENEFAGGGWGYNKIVGTDADSTAYSILFLASEHDTVSEESYRCLSSFQGSDGGFSTYHSLNNSWGVSHPEVSAIAVLALLTKYSIKDVMIDRGIRYVQEQQTLSGLWNSFWWHSPLYATEASLSLVHRTEWNLDTAGASKSLASIIPSNCFESALMISILGWMAPTVEFASAHRFIDRLLEEQQSDGSWKSEPILRVTRRDCYEPWRLADAGTLYSDPNRLFTSSTVLGAMSRAYALL